MTPTVTIIVMAVVAVIVVAVVVAVVTVVMVAIVAVVASMVTASVSTGELVGGFCNRKGFICLSQQCTSRHWEWVTHPQRRRKRQE